jgi:hypothetical protein
MDAESAANGPMQSGTLHTSDEMANGQISSSPVVFVGNFDSPHSQDVTHFTDVTDSHYVTEGAVAPLARQITLSLDEDVSGVPNDVTMTKTNSFVKVDDDGGTIIPVYLFDGAVTPELPNPELCFHEVDGAKTRPRKPPRKPQKTKRRRRTLRLSQKQKQAVKRQAKKVS